MIGPPSSHLSNDGRYCCKLCPCSYKNFKHLKRHSTRHANDVEFRCLYCNSTFMRADSLKRHTHSCSHRWQPRKGENGECTSMTPCLQPRRSRRLKDLQTKGIQTKGIQTKGIQTKGIQDRVQTEPKVTPPISPEDQSPGYARCDTADSRFCSDLLTRKVEEWPLMHSIGIRSPALDPFGVSGSGYNLTHVPLVYSPVPDAVYAPYPYGYIDFESLSDPLHFWSG